MNAQEIVKRVESIERGRYSVVKRFLLLGSDGKKYGTAGFPLGVEILGRSDAYWVFQYRDGTTYGKRYGSEAEAIAANEESAKRHGREMALALEKMTKEQLKAQSDYWEKQ
jgi:hypothetical protein